MKTHIDINLTGFSTVLSVVQIVLLVLKFTKLIDWDWLHVWIPTIINVVLLIIVIGGVLVWTKWKEKH